MIRSSLVCMRYRIRADLEVSYVRLCQIRMRACWI